MMGDQVYDEASPDSSSFRRVWKRRNGRAQGASQLVLKAMAVLYDAGEPLTPAEIAERLLTRLDPYERDYLEAWILRRREQQARSVAKKRGQLVEPVATLTGSTTTLQIVMRWVSQILAHQGRRDRALIRDPDGRYRPGPKAPTVQTMDGKLKPFTPESRRELEQADHDRGRTHLVQLEFQRAVRTLDFSSPDARAALAIFLIRHLFTLAPKAPITDRQLKAEFKHLVHIADTPAVKHAVLQLAMNYLSESSPHTGS